MARREARDMTMVERGKEIDGREIDREQEREGTLLFK